MVGGEECDGESNEEGRGKEEGIGPLQKKGHDGAKAKEAKRLAGGWRGRKRRRGAVGGEWGMGGGEGWVRKGAGGERWGRGVE